MKENLLQEAIASIVLTLTGNNMNIKIRSELNYFILGIVMLFIGTHDFFSYTFSYALTAIGIITTGISLLAMAMDEE